MTEAIAAREEAFAFACEGESLFAVLHYPKAQACANTAAAATAVVIIVGGPQYRAGSHRQFVHLARALAAAGHPVLRFDVRGMGDSTGSLLRNFEQITPDVGAAIDALLQRIPQLKRVVLWGLCDGASAALLYLHDRPDPRVIGLCLLNPWVRSVASLARTHVKHYYLQRLGQREFWSKLFSGQVASVALRDLAQNLRAAALGKRRSRAGPEAFQDRMARAWLRLDRPILLALSGDDYSAREFIEFTSSQSAWRGLLAAPRVTRHTIDGANHTFSATADRACIEAITLNWLSSVGRPGSAGLAHGVRIG